MSPKRKSLVILTPGFAKDESDTTCLPMQQSFIRELNHQFPALDTIIMAFQYPYEKKTYQWRGNTVISFDGRNRGGLAKFFLFQKLNKALKEIHKANRIDGLLSFWYRECALVGQRFAAKHDIKHYCWMWGQDARIGNKYVYLARLNAEELIAFSDHLQCEFEKNYDARPLHVITPGIDPGDYSRNNPEKDIDILGVGSLIPLKQYDVFIRVIAEIKKQFPLIRTVLVGEGPERQKLEHLIVSLELQSNITLTGEGSHPEVLKWMKRSKILLHPSSYEGFGIVCIEALGSGADVISFIKPMNNDIENWHIVRSDEEMINKAIGLLGKPKAEYKTVIPYTIAQTVQKVAALFSF